MKDEQFWDYAEKKVECWEWTGKLLSNGYGYFAKGLAHRYAWSLINGEIPKGMYVMHSCDNRKCINPEHLSIGTPKENTQDMVRKKRYVKSENPFNANYRNKPFMLNKDDPEEKELYEWLKKKPKRWFKQETKEYWLKKMKEDKNEPY